MATTNEMQEWLTLARARLAARGKTKPDTKAGAVRALWPVIQVAMENGQSLKTIRDWLEHDGVFVTYKQLTSYISRIRRTEKQHRLRSELNDSGQATARVDVKEVALRASTVDVEPQRVRSADPLANVRAREAKRPTFQYSPDFKEDELI